MIFSREILSYRGLIGENMQLYMIIIITVIIQKMRKNLISRNSTPILSSSNINQTFMCFDQTLLLLCLLSIMEDKLGVKKCLKPHL